MAKNAAAVLPPAVFELIPVASISPSSTNARKIPDDARQKELNASVALQGVLVATIVRRLEAGAFGYELVAGHRRLVAAKAAGLKTIPARVMELNDAEALEVGVVENLQRADIHPLDEADAFQELTAHASVEEVAKKVGKSSAFVYQRLQLCSLADRSRERFLAGALTVSHAFLLARIPDVKQQNEACDALFEEGWQDDDSPAGEAPCSVTEARRIILHNFTLRLVDARFDQSDATLPGGACTTCPKATGNQRELFSDVDDKANLCTDPACHKKKADTTWDRKSAEAEAEGKRTLDEGETKKIFPHRSDSLAYGARYIDPAERCNDDPKGRTYAKLLGKDAPPAVLARAPSGAAVELLDRAEVTKALVAKGVIKKAATPASSGGSNDASAARHRAAAKAYRVNVNVIMAALVAAAPKQAEEKLWRLIIGGLFEGSWHDVIKAATNRRGFEIKAATGAGGRTAGNPLKKQIDTMTLGELRGLGLELVISRGTIFHRSGALPASLTNAAKTCGLDVKAILAEAREEQKPATKKAKSGRK